MVKHNNRSMICTVIYALSLASGFPFLQNCFGNDGNGAVFAEGLDSKEELSGNPYVTGAATNVLESLARNVYIIHEKEINANKGDRGSTFLGKLGLSDTLQGVLIAGLMSGIGMLFRAVLQMRTEDRQAKAMLAQEKRAQKRRVNEERKRAYLDFMAFFYLANNYFRIHNDPMMPEGERQKFDNLMPAESVARAAEINARMRLFASKEIAEAHLKFMDAVKIIYSATDRNIEKRAEDVRKILILISDAMNKELCQLE